MEGRQSLLDPSLGKPAMSEYESANAANWLSLAAAPTFAAMAMLTGVIGSGRVALICTAPTGLSWLAGMVPMYLLMSGFHLAPWLTLVAKWRQGRPVSRGCGQAGPS